MKDEQKEGGRGIKERGKGREGGEEGVLKGLPGWVEEVMSPGN